MGVYNISKNLPSYPPDGGGVSSSSFGGLGVWGICTVSQPFLGLRSSGNRPQTLYLESAGAALPDCGSQLPVLPVPMAPLLPSSSSFGPSKFFELPRSFFPMLLSHGIATSITTAFFCCLLINTVLVSHHQFVSLDLRVQQDLSPIGFLLSEVFT